MLGKPKYNYKDVVSFNISENGKTYTLIGRIYIIDSHGTFMDNSDVSYDIMVEKGDYPIGIGYPCLFKHIREDKVTPAKL